MKVALITPYSRDTARGNAVTVLRIQKYLRELGCDTTVYPLDEISPENLLAEVTCGGFDLCHAFHAHLGGSVALKLREHCGIPYVITFTGSDVYESLTDARRDEVLANLASASYVVTFHKVIADRAVSLASAVTNTITVISQGVDLPVLDNASAASGQSDGFIFLLPAGIRPVKNLIPPLNPLAELRRSHPEVRLKIAGPVLDQEYATQLLSLLPDYPFASYLGVVGHQDMGELYRKADVVLNSSHFEGGMANSLLEAMSWGKPVLASDIEGNRSLVTDGLNGLLYSDSEDFRYKAEKLVSEPELRSRLGMAGRLLVQENHSPEREAAAYLRLYGDVVAKGGVAVNR